MQVLHHLTKLQPLFGHAGYFPRLKNNRSGVKNRVVTTKGIILSIPIFQTLKVTIDHHFGWSDFSTNQR